MSTPTESQLERMLDFVKRDVFLGKNSAFLGSLLCSHEFVWDHDGKTVQTAATDGRTIWWAVQHFLSSPTKQRQTVLLHELWHTGLLHFIRQGNRDPHLWNIACDYRINNNLLYDGQELGANWYYDRSLDKDGILAEEQIYDLLLQNKIPRPKTPMGDMKPAPGNPQQQQNQVGAVIRAVQAAEMAGQAGNLPGNLKKFLKDFLQPKIPWKSTLHKWMTDLMDDIEYTWKRPNRRYSHVYLPSHEQPEGRVEHLVYFLDTSGSITEKQMIRFNSEVRYIKEVLKPKKLTLIQFDAIIQFKKTFAEEEVFEDIEMHGGGGTSLIPVRDWIEKHKPTAAIIFSDLFVDPMEPLTSPIPIIWVAVNNKHATVPFGENLIFIDE